MSTLDTIKKEEEKIEKEIKKAVLKAGHYRSLIGIIVVALLLGGFIYWRATFNQVKIDLSSIQAPMIDLSPTTPGILYQIYVKEGDKVDANTQIAKVGDEIITSKVSGIIATVNHKEGQVFTPGISVVSMVNIGEERVIGRIDENKGLSKIKVGDTVRFTVDAFDSKSYEGIVEEVSPVSRQSGILFSISDKREIKQFEVKIKFNINAYPELKSGMSAKATVFVK
jgi:multidrug resistance efflux pump